MESAAKLALVHSLSAPRYGENDFGAPQFLVTASLRLDSVAVFPPPAPLRALSANDSYATRWDGNH